LVLHKGAYEDYRVLLELMKPTLVHEGIATEAQFEEVYQLMLE